VTVEEADAALETAIRDVAAARGMLAEGEFIGDWVVVVEGQRVDDPDTSPYLTLLPNGLLATHKIVGLLRLAEMNRSRPDGDA
jgi:hypothetical protein